jgi:hypothetical protein
VSFIVADLLFVIDSFTVSDRQLVINLLPVA